MINVFFDTKPLRQGHSVRGIGYYTKNLLEQLQKEKNIKLVDNASDAEVVHFPYFDLFFNTLKPVQGKKNIVTIFDVIPLIYPMHYPPGIKGKVNFFKQKQALKKIDAIITISETSKKDIVRFLDVEPHRIYPIHLAPQSDFRKLAKGSWENNLKYRYNLPDRFVLYVGDVNYNKNLIALAKACVRINTPLVIVGKQAVDETVNFSHTENRSFSEFLRSFKYNKNVIRIGFVETQDLVGIYNLATVYCQPSLYEGFGIPVLEAQACGVPVVAARTQALVEIAEKSCQFVKNPIDNKEFADIVLKVIENRKLQERLAKSGLENAKLFSWKQTLDKTKEVYELYI